MSTPNAVRHINETRVLGALFRAGPMSRADLARALGLTRSTAGLLVGGLVQHGLVLDHAGAPVDRVERIGRPGLHVRLNPRHAVFLGAEIGVGCLTVVALDFLANPIGRGTTTFDVAGSTPASIAGALAALIRGVSAKLRMPDAPRSLGVAVPGLLGRDGHVLRAPILGWAAVPVLTILRPLLPKMHRIAAENDAHAFAMAERYRPGSAAPADALYILLDAGVGGGIVSGGVLLRGQNGYAGEIGHVLVGEGGFVQPSPLAGSLESFIGREAVIARHRFHGGAAGGFDDVLAAVAAQAPPALAMLGEWSHHLGRGIATLINLTDPQRVILGGPVAALHEFARDAVLASVRQHMLADHPIPDIALSPLGRDGVAIGAAAMMHQRMLAFDENLVFNGNRGSAEA